MYNIWAKPLQFSVNILSQIFREPKNPRIFYMIGPYISKMTRIAVLRYYFSGKGENGIARFSLALKCAWILYLLYELSQKFVIELSKFNRFPNLFVEIVMILEY